MSENGSDVLVYTVTMNGATYRFRSDDPNMQQGLLKLVNLLRDFIQGDRKIVQDFKDDTWCVVRGISDLLGGTSFPGTDMYDDALNLVDLAESAVKDGAYPLAVNWISAAVTSENECQEKWESFIADTTKGAESAVHGLRVTVDVSIAVEGALATGGLADAMGGGVAADALAGGLTGEVSGAASDAFNQHVDVLLGTRKEVDWSEVGRKGIEGLVGGVVGGLVGGPIKDWMGANLPSLVGKDYALFTRLAQSLEEETGEKLEADVLMSKAEQIWGDVMTKLPEAALTSTLKSTIEALGNKEATADELMKDWVGDVFKDTSVDGVVVGLLKSLVEK